MTRTITFTEYRIAKEQNPNKSDSEIFNIAWRTSPDAKMYNTAVKACKYTMILGLGYLFSVYGLEALVEFGAMPLVPAYNNDGMYSELYKLIVID